PPRGRKGGIPGPSTQWLFNSRSLFPPSIERVNAEKSHDLVAKGQLLALIRPNLVPKWVIPDNPLLNSGTFQAALSRNQAPCVVNPSTKCNPIIEYLGPNRNHLSDRLTSFCNHPGEH